jgi:DNA-binding NarL/FixJ family response regulator
MMYHGGCSTTSSVRYLPAQPDLATPRFARVSPQPEAAPAVKSPVRVLVAGDHATLRACLKTMLELDTQIQVVGEATDDCEIVKMSRRLHPDVVLIDLDMYCCDNYEAIADITRQQLASSVVGLTIHDEPAERAVAQSAGVNLFLEKGVPYKQLINAVRLAAANSFSR